MSAVPEALSLERMTQARETLTEAAHAVHRGELEGAVDGDGFGSLIEAKRNLTAMIGHLHGNEAWERVLDGD